jgi:hypothetical protein
VERVDAKGVAGAVSVRVLDSDERRVAIFMLGDAMSIFAQHAFSRFEFARSHAAEEVETSSTGGRDTASLPALRDGAPIHSENSSSDKSQTARPNRMSFAELVEAFEVVGRVVHVSPQSKPSQCTSSEWPRRTHASVVVVLSMRR